MAQDEKKPQGGGEVTAAAGGLISAEKMADITKGKGAAAPAEATPPAAAPAGTKEPAKIAPRGGDAAAVAAAKAAQGEAKPAAGEKIEPIVVKTPFGQKIFGAAKEDEEGQVTLQSFEDVQSFAKANSLDIKEVNDLQGFIKDYTKFKAESGKLGPLQSQIDTYERTLKSLPNEVSLILNAAVNNQDYTSIINEISQSSTLNFAKPFVDYNERELINHYNDEKFNQEQFKEMEDGQLKALTRLAKTKYETDQANHVAQVQQAQRSNELAQQQFNQSVENSIKQLRSNNPDMGEPEIKRVRDVMTGELHDTLFEGDNTYKVEAAERIAMQEFGKEAILAQQHTIADIVAKVQNQGKSEANEQILQHSDKRPIAAVGAGGADENRLSAAVQKETSFMKASG